jgi:hypothetical protein
MIRVDNGSTLFLARGDTSMVLVDDGSVASRQIRSNVPFAYEEGSIGSI